MHEVSPDEIEFLKRMRKFLSTEDEGKIGKKLGKALNKTIKKPRII